MKTFKAILTLAITIGLIWALNTRLPLSAPVPPLGKFLDPFHGFWQNCYADGARENLTLDGLSGPVEEVYDSAHIPHIYAANEEDLFFAQGFVTASDRLWQMEFQTHAAAGRVSELLGIGKDSAYLNYDRDQRRLGMVLAATNFLAMVEQDPEMSKLANKYTEGINQYISTLNDRTLPVEYKLLDYRPEPWTNLKIGLLLKSMARTLNTGDKDVEMTNALKLLGLAQLDLLFP
ncbi:MAG: penicillin acylase family protein, partial [Bacteroidota bacterium]